MSTPEATARNRYFLMIAVRIASAGGAAFGVVLLARAPNLPLKLLSIGIILSAMMVMGTAPRALARKWRTPPEA